MTAAARSHSEKRPSGNYMPEKESELRQSMRTLKRNDKVWRVILVHGSYYLQHEDDEPIGPFFSQGQINEWVDASDAELDEKPESQPTSDKPE